MDVKLEWLGCATFRLTVAETVIFLDAYMDRPDTAPRLEIRPEAVERADFVLVGHSHSDHLWGAERVTENTGATVIGSHETFRVLTEQEGVSEDQLAIVAGGERIQLSDNVSVRVYPSLHSATWSSSPNPAPDEICLGDRGVFYQDRLVGAASTRSSLRAGPDPDGLIAAAEAVRARNKQQPRTEGGAWAYLIETPAGSIYWADTMGYWTGVLGSIRPDVAILAAQGRGTANGEPVQGTIPEFIADQVTLMRPRRVVLDHHDDWSPPLTRPAEVTEMAVRDHLNRSHPEVDFVSLDYLDPVPILEDL